MTRWGPRILKAKSRNGWNVDFRDGHPVAGMWATMNDFVAMQQQPLGGFIYYLGFNTGAISAGSFIKLFKAKRIFDEIKAI